MLQPKNKKCEIYGILKNTDIYFRFCILLCLLKVINSQLTVSFRVFIFHLLRVKLVKACKTLINLIIISMIKVNIQTILLKYKRMEAIIYV